MALQKKLVAFRLHLQQLTKQLTSNLSIPATGTRQDNSYKVWHPIPKKQHARTQILMTEKSNLYYLKSLIVPSLGYSLFSSLLNHFFPFLNFKTWYLQAITNIEESQQLLLVEKWGFFLSQAEVFRSLSVIKSK